MTKFIIRIEEASIPVLIAYNQWDEATTEGGLDALKQRLLAFIERLHKDSVVPSSGDYIKLNDEEVYGIESRRIIEKGDDFEVRLTVFETTRYAKNTEQNTEDDLEQE